MNFRRSVNNILDMLGLIGFTVRSDRKKGAWKDLSNRVWGVSSEHFALSVQVRPSESRVRTPVRMIIALRNESEKEVSVDIPGWLGYFHIAVLNVEGRELEPTVFGSRTLRREDGAKRRVAVSPAEPVQIEVPLSDIFDLDIPGNYAIEVSCVAPGSASGARCQSNSVSIRREL